VAATRAAWLKGYRGTDVVRDGAFAPTVRWLSPRFPSPEETADFTTGITKKARTGLAWRLRARLQIKAVRERAMLRPRYVVAHVPGSALSTELHASRHDGIRTRDLSIRSRSNSDLHYGPETKGARVRLAWRLPARRKQSRGTGEADLPLARLVMLTVS
jgi:hypothetical protein